MKKQAFTSLRYGGLWGLCALFIFQLAAKLPARSDDFRPTGYAASNTAASDAQLHTICTSINIGDFTLENSDKGTKVHVQGYGRLSQPGEPFLPARIFSIALPPGAEFLDLKYEAQDETELPGSHYIRPVLPSLLLQEEQAEKPSGEWVKFAQTYTSIYAKSSPYPPDNVQFVRTAGFRKYNLVDVRITPFKYLPFNGRLQCPKKILVYVTYRQPQNSESLHAWHKPSGPRSKKTAQEIILNYDQAQAWYAEGDQWGLSDQKGQDRFDFVLITLDNLTSSVTSLITWEKTKGRSPKLVTTSWIESNYNGADSAEKIRSFLREKYPADAWGIEDVLIVGHRDDIPMRRMRPSNTTNPPETDFYYAELSRPDSESWDSDGDRAYGEDSDNIDFYAEVNIGRIPWSDPQVVRRICEKSASFERNTDPSFKNNVLLLAAFVDADTDGAEFMEYTVDPDIHPWMAQWGKTRLYEADSEHEMDHTLTHGNVRSVWSSGKFAVVSWHAHGSPIGSYVGGSPFISVDDCDFLNDNYPAIISAASCSNADTDYLNIGQAMMRQGAVGFLGANKSAWYGGGWRNPNDGSDQSFKYFFLSQVTSGEYTQGQALQYAIREMYLRGLWDYLRLETYIHSSIWGNPDLGVASPFQSNPPEAPNWVNGVRRGQMEVDYDFTTVTTDPNLDQVYYCWFWGDDKIEWQGPFSPGTTVSNSHSWSQPGTYSVKVKACDSHGAESGWSDPLTLTIIMTKSIKRPRR